jgi:hypothetical protein
MGAAVSITRLDVTAAELRMAAGREKDGSAARRMLAAGKSRRAAMPPSCSMARAITSPKTSRATSPSSLCRPTHPNFENVWEYLRGNKLAIIK